MNVIISVAWEVSTSGHAFHEKALGHDVLNGQVYLFAKLFRGLGAASLAELLES